MSWILTPQGGKDNMSRVITINKDCVSFLRIKCKACKQHFEQLYHRQQHCQTVECQRARHTIYQRNLRRKKAGILEVSV
jgi:hypothetical protein